MKQAWMPRSMTYCSAVAAVVALGVLASGASLSWASDDLACWSFKDSFGSGSAKFSATLDLDPDDAAFADLAGCEVKVKSKELCVPAGTTVSDDGGAPGGAVTPTDLGNAFVCYKAKCPKVSVPDDTEITDRFGTRDATKFKSTVKRFCTQVAAAAPDLPCDGDGCLMFASSLQYSSDLRLGEANAIAGTNAECDRLAGLAGLPGTYVSWLSTATVDAIDRFDLGSGPILSTCGGTVATDVADLVASGPSVPACDESASAIAGDPSVWTGTTAAGISSGDHCLSFASTSDSFNGTGGVTTATNSSWTEAGFTGCSGAMNRIYCIEQ